MRFEKTFELKSDLIVRIKRINVDKRTFKGKKRIPIQNSAYYHLTSGSQEEYYLLPKLYAALTYVTGPDDSLYDHWKGSFSFCFELDVQKNHVTSQYFYHMHHYRSYIDITVSQIVPSSDPRRSEAFHQPNDEFFSDIDICHFSNYFSGYCLGYIEGARCYPNPFLKKSDSNLLLFGYYKNKYFIEQFADHEEYDKQQTLLLGAGLITDLEDTDFSISLLDLISDQGGN